MLGSSIVLIGIFIIFLGFILIFVSGINNQLNQEKKDEYYSNADYGDNNTLFNSNDSERGIDKIEVRGGGVIMIGPIPIIVGSDSKSTQTLIVLVIILMVLYFLFFM